MAVQGRVPAEIEGGVPPAAVSVTARRLVLAVPLQGTLAASRGTPLAAATPGTVVLLAQPGSARLTWSPDALAIVLDVPRPALQIALSRRLGAAHRYAASDLCLHVGDEAVARLCQQGLSDPGRRLSAPGAEMLAGMLLGRPEGQAFVLPARSVQRAVAYIAARPEGALDTERIAAAAGVTPRTLLEGFRACLGMSLQHHVQEVRLAHLRARLASGRESRTIAELARLGHFRNPSQFTRLYARRFGEAPSQTRAVVAAERVASTQSLECRQI